MAEELSIFQQKYNEFVNDLLGALPEYQSHIEYAKMLDATARLQNFKSVKIEESEEKNPGTILPGVTIADDIWVSLSEQTRKAIWEHLRILSMCHFMEAEFNTNENPSWMDDAMNNMKSKLNSDEFQNLVKHFMKFFKNRNDANNSDNADADNADDADDEKNPKMPNFQSFFEKGMPKLPERFMNGHLVRLAQEIVKDIKPEDLGLDAEMISECEKDSSRAFSVLYTTLKNKPEIIQKIIVKVVKRIEQKVKSGSIRVEEITKEVEELIKEFADNPEFVEMMDGIKNAFGFDKMGATKKQGKDESSRLSMVRDRLRKKLDKKKTNKK